MSDQDNTILDAVGYTVSNAEKKNIEEMSIAEEIRYIFNEDPLYQVIEEEGLQEELIPEKLLSELNRKNQYTIAEAAERLEKKDYQIRNIIQRNGLEEYVQITQAGKLYRLDYKGIYRLYLIFVLQDQLGKRPVDIASLVGVMPETVKEEAPKPPVRKGTNTVISPSAVHDQLDSLENQMFSMFLYTQMVREYDIRRQAYQKAVVDVSNWEKEMDHINQLIELHESILHMAKEEQKELQALKKNVSDVVEGVNQAFGDVAKSQGDIYSHVNRANENSGGFLAKLFGKRKAPLDGHETKITIREIAITAEEVKTNLIVKKEELEKLKADRAALEKQKSLIHDLKNKALIEYQDFKDKMEEEKVKILKETKNPSIKLLLEQPLSDFEPENKIE
ncbi:hypothetical protein HPT25_26165 [Bacillus sp. BRMEA1]|uniref:hypothetical protein n=1 Tax=Neobacillus endophyticus TaxID=2738405 RepID=UPI001566AE22|nr:hypothetical protein [Neobacillus endophyticus]NRD80816.1 hypothetical protein [Neobacillus endophyticus]